MQPSSHQNMIGKSPISTSNSYHTTCRDHNLEHNNICLSENCKNRWLCPLCKAGHNEKHLRSVCSLSEICEESFSTFVHATLSSKEAVLVDKMKSKANLLKKINKAFHDLQIEIEEVLIKTKTDIIQSIEKAHQDLVMDFNEEKFQEIKESLTSLASDLGRQQPADFNVTVDHFSSTYSKTISCIDDGIKNALKFEEKEFNFQGILDLVKTSCHALLAKMTLDSPAEIVKQTLGRAFVKTAPQEITCLAHCRDLGIFITGGKYGLITLWNDKEFSYLSQLHTHEGTVSSIVYFPNLKTIVTASSDNSMGIMKLKADGSVETINKKKTQRVIQDLIAMEDENKIATMSEQGVKIRIAEVPELDMVNSSKIDLPPNTQVIKMFYVSAYRLIGVISPDSIKLYSTTDTTMKCNLRATVPIVTACYLQESESVHGIIIRKDPSGDKYEEIIWKKRDNEFHLVSTRDIEKTKFYGKPIDFVSNSSMILTVFGHGVTLRRVEEAESPSKMVELASQECKTENQRPVLLDDLDMKFYVTTETRKLKIFNFS